MDNNKILQKITEILEEVNLSKNNQKVLVMHPSTMMLVKDKITRYHDIYNTREAFLFEGGITLYLSFKVKVDHFLVMTEAEYRNFESQK